MEKSQPLIEFFMKHMVDPVVEAYRKQEESDSEKEIMASLKTKIEQYREDLVHEIQRFENTSDVRKTMNHLLDNVVKIEEALAPYAVSVSSTPAPFTSRFEEDQEIPSPISEKARVEAPCSPYKPSPKNLESIEVNVNQSEQTHIVSPPIFSPDKASFEKGMPSRKRAKRSLEDTVQMLFKENSSSPPPAASVPQLPFVLPRIPVPFTNTAMLHRWLGSPFANPVYLNAMNMIHQQPPPNPSDEQMAALMKISMHAANFMKNVSSPQAPQAPQIPNSYNGSSPKYAEYPEDIKVEVESDEGEIEVSPSPSAGDTTENESSSSSTGPMTSPSGADGESALEKPFICMHNNCGKRFANKFLLKKHMFIHTGLRPHTCPHCHKKFNRKDNLLRHKKTHTPASTQLGALLPKTPFHGLPQLPNLHSLALTQGFNHFHALKMSLENGATAVRSLS